MKNLFYDCIWIAILIFSSCSNDSFLEFANDPNKPTSAPASLILNRALFDIYENPTGSYARWNQYYLCNYNYYGNNEYSWTTNAFDFYTLKNVVKMIEENKKTGAPDLNGYNAMAKFLKAYFSYRMTMRFGDIPMSQALLGSENTAPSYDSQKQVFSQILQYLDDANNDMTSLINSGKRNVEGDIYYGGDLVKWQKAVNSFKIRVLIQLSKRVSESDLRIKERFAEILANPGKFPIFNSNADNLSFTYIANINNYPLNPGNEGFDKRRYNMAATYLNTLVAMQDPRTFVVADPAEALIAAGKKPTDFDAYLGASNGESLDDMTFKMNKGGYSAINQKRYYGTYGGPEPGVIVGYVEMAENIAEGITMGWSAGDANEWYTKGIKASFSFYGINDNATINNYLNQDIIKLKSSAESKLNQIITQKYLGMFLNSGLEGYYNWRRTGIPAFLAGVGTGNSGVIPFRWQYPTAERSANASNYTATLSSQYGGKDDINLKMWLIK